MLSRSPGLEPEEAPLDHAAARTIIIGILLAMMLSAIEQSIVGPALPTIGGALSDIENLPWVVTAYLLAATAATPLAGKLSDIYGRRAIMLIAIGIFIVGSVACALAPTIWALILARALQGIGGGGILPLAQTIIADVVSPRDRPRYLSYTSLMFMVASIAGPLVGGVFAEHLHWSLIFWINLPLGIVAYVLTDKVLKRLPRHDRPHRLDVSGALLMVGAALTLMFALSSAGVRWPWLSLPTLALVAGSIALWVLFALRLMTAPEPFIPLTVLRDQVVRTATCASFCIIGVFTGLSIFIPLYLELVLNLSASASGGVLITFMIGTVLGSLGSGRVMARVRHYKLLPVIGLVFAIAAMAVLAAVPGSLPVTAVGALIGVIGTGVGPMWPMSTVVIQNAVLPHQFGTATGTLNFSRLLGGAILVAGFGAIVLAHIGSTVRDPAALRRLAADTAGSHEIAAAFGFVFLAAGVALAIGLAFLLAMEERPLRASVKLPVVTE